MITINQVLEILRGDPELDAIGCHFESEPHIRRTSRYRDAVLIRISELRAEVGTG